MSEVIESQCRVCDNAGELQFQVNKWPLTKCSQCDLIQVASAPTTAELDEIYSRGYFDSHKYSNKGPLEKETERRLELLKKCGLSKGGRVLEIGCATGFFVEKMLDDYEVYATDYSEESIDQLGKRLPSLEGKLSSGAIEDLVYPSNHFDAIIMWDVIEHIWGVQELSQQMSKWLKPNGALLVSSPDIGGWIPKIFKKRWAFMTPPEHLTFFTKKSLTTLFKQVGMEPTYYRRHGKWVNLGFLVYKLGRVFPAFGSLKIHEWLPSWLARRSLYVPTNDIFYAILKKRS